MKSYITRILINSVIALLVLGLNSCKKEAENSAPVAVLLVTPERGTTETDFVFNAGYSYDAQDVIDLLSYRWDINADGDWETQYSLDHEFTYRFTDPGTFVVAMEVMDTKGLSDTESINVEVSSPNTPPEVPYNPQPEHQARDLGLEIMLEWECSDPEGDPLSFDIYLGTTNNPPLIASNVIDTSYDPGSLEAENTYYWKVRATDSHDNSTIGPLWSFTTKNQINPPVSGEWDVTTEFGGFVMTVNEEGTHISKFAITHSNWSCGGVGLGGTVTVSSNPGWEISDGQFTFKKSLDPNPFTDNHNITITGTFMPDGTRASGTWKEVVYGSTCTGTWEVEF